MTTPGFNSAQVLLDLEKLGVALTLEDGRLIARPERKVKKLPPDLRHQMRENKKAQITAVRAIERGGGIFRVAGRSRSLQTTAIFD